MLAQEFAEKAKVNAEFVLAALGGLGRDALVGGGMVPALGLHPANQLIAEGIELAIKAFTLARGSTPAPDHRLRCLYALLDEDDKTFVDETVRSAVDESATSPVPFGLPNVASAAQRSVVGPRLGKSTQRQATLAAHKSLVEQITARTIRREYLAVVRGRVIAGGVIDAPIGRHPVHRTRMAVVRRHGRRAITHYRVETRYRAHTALSVRLDTGRTHQIRVHLAHRESPIVGDPDYGGRAGPTAGATPGLQEALRRFDRQALHARRLILRHPATGHECEWTVPPPDDLKALLAALAADAGPHGTARAEHA